LVARRLCKNGAFLPRHMGLSDDPLSSHHLRVLVDWHDPERVKGVPALVHAGARERAHAERAEEGRSTSTALKARADSSSRPRRVPRQALALSATPRGDRRPPASPTLAAHGEHREDRLVSAPARHSRLRLGARCFALPDPPPGWPASQHRRRIVGRAGSRAIQTPGRLWLDAPAKSNRSLRHPTGPR
jgi:hypothetical protein